MPNHFSDIGFHSESIEETMAILSRAAPTLGVPVPGGSCICWSTSAGAEVWIPASRSNEADAVIPHFAGECQLRVGLLESFFRYEDSEFIGGFIAYAEAPADDPDSWRHPFLVDVPDWARHHQLEMPCRTEISIACFAEKVNVFPTEEGCKAFWGKDVLGPISSPVNSKELAPGEIPEAVSFVSGFVLDAEERVNDITKKPFYWMSVRTASGVIDAVSDPEYLGSLPAKGSILAGLFWISGRLIREEETKAVHASPGHRTVLKNVS